MYVSAYKSMILLLIDLSRSEKDKYLDFIKKETIEIIVRIISASTILYSQDSLMLPIPYSIYIPVQPCKTWIKVEP